MQRVDTPTALALVAELVASPVYKPSLKPTPASRLLEIPDKMQ